MEGSKLGMRDRSHAITKVKPEIRVVHIFAPEIIKTDPANFRELVQRLTGKPTKGKDWPVTTDRAKIKPAVCKLVQAVGARRGYQPRCEEDGGSREEGQLWASSGEFLGSLKDIDSFLQGLNDFPRIPLSSSLMDLVGGAHVS